MALRSFLSSVSQTSWILLTWRAASGKDKGNKPAWTLNDAHWRVIFYAFVARGSPGLEYERSYMTLGELVDQLMAWSLSADRDDLIEHLRDVGYFHLSGYWNIFKLSDGTFRGGVSFSEVWRLYTFDRHPGSAPLTGWSARRFGSRCVWRACSPVTTGSSAAWSPKDSPGSARGGTRRS